jgi:hypothetical protein
VAAKLNLRLQLAILAKRLRRIRLADCAILEPLATAVPMTRHRSNVRSIRQIDTASTAKAELFE